MECWSDGLMSMFLDGFAGVYSEMLMSAIVSVLVNELNQSVNAGRMCIIAAG